jgi:hypothetical protein
VRDRTQVRVEELAVERALTVVTLQLMEDGIDFGRQMMAEMLKAQGVGVPNAALHEAPSPAATVADRNTAHIAHKGRPRATDQASSQTAAAGNLVVHLLHLVDVSSPTGPQPAGGR